MDICTYHIMFPRENPMMGKARYILMLQHSKGFSIDYFYIDFLASV